MNSAVKNFRIFFYCWSHWKKFRKFLIVNFRLLKKIRNFLLLNSLKKQFENFLHSISLKKISKMFYCWIHWKTFRKFFTVNLIEKNISTFFRKIWKKLFCHKKERGHRVKIPTIFPGESVMTFRWVLIF